MYFNLKNLFLFSILFLFFKIISVDEDFTDENIEELNSLVSENFDLDDSLEESIDELSDETEEILEEIENNELEESKIIFKFLNYKKLIWQENSKKEEIKVCKNCCK